MNKIKAENIKYSIDKIHGPNGIWFGYVFSIVGLFISTICLSSTIRIYSKINVFSIDVIAGIIGVLIGIIFLCIGIVRIINKIKIKSFVRYIKQNGTKTQGIIKKCYIEVIDVSDRTGSEDSRNIDYHYYYLKVSYYNEDSNKEETFITPRILGFSRNISSNKVDVYYYNGDAIIDNLIIGNEKVEFEEGIFEGNPKYDL